MTDISTTQAMPEAAASSSNEFSLDDLDRAYFGPDDFGAASDLLTKIQAVLPEDQIYYNIDLASELPPEGYGIYIVPVRQRGEAGADGVAKSELIGVCFYAAPSFDMVMSDEKGREYVQDALFGVFAAKMANSIRPNKDGILGKKPFSLADFIERKSRGDSFKTYNELKKPIVEALRKMGLRTINASVLRQCLSNAAIAASQYPNVRSEHWAKILDFCVSLAESRRLDPAIFASWKATRDHASAHDEEIDFSALSDILG